MATKAESLRAQMQREANPPKPPKRRGRGLDPAQPARRSKNEIPAGDVIADAASGPRGRPSKGAKAHGTRAENHAQVKIETSASGKSSRKSTRVSANGHKGATQLTRRVKSAVRSPEARAAKAQVRSTTVRGSGGKRL